MPIPAPATTELPERRGTERPDPSSAAAADRSGRIDVRSYALTGLFVLAAVYTLHVARDLFLPVVLAALLKVVFEPVVRFLGRARIKAPVAAGVVVLLCLAALTACVVLLKDPALDWLDRLPVALRRVEHTIAELRGPVDQVTEAAEQVEKITGMDSAEGAAPASPSLSQMLFVGLWRIVGTTAVMFVLLYFLLASEDLFLRKLVRILPRLEDKKRAVEVARQIENDVSRHLLVMTTINLGLGFATAGALYLAGMPNPLLWGLLGALLNYIPYLGPLIGSAIVGAAAFLTFDDPGRVFLVVAIFLVLTSLEGNVLTPLLLGRHLALNPVAIFLAFSFWSFLWGPIGALIAMPLLIVFKALCDRIEKLAPVGEFLSAAGDARPTGDQGAAGNGSPATAPRQSR